jgi:hypothetical protein
VGPAIPGSDPRENVFDLPAIDVNQLLEETKTVKRNLIRHTFHRRRRQITVVSHPNTTLAQRDGLRQALRDQQTSLIDAEI